MSAPAQALTEICGADSVRAGQVAARNAVVGVVPAAVVAPRDTEQVAAVLACCSEEGWTVEPSGLGTWLAAGARPRRVDVVLSTRRLDAISTRASADATASAGAGARLDTIAERLRPLRQYLALDPPGARTGSVGATFATASAGPLRYGLGTPRDHALGVTVVTGDGRTLGFGGKVVKNVAGYDVVRLMVGSRGTLGVITELHFRLRPYPQHDVTVVAPAPGPGVAVELAAAARACDPVALKLLSPALVRAVIGSTGWLVAARFHGARESVDDAQARLIEVANRLQPATPSARRAPAADGAGEGAEAGPEGTRALDRRDAAVLWAKLRASEGSAEVLVRMAGLADALDGTLATALRVAGAGRGRASGAADSWYIAAHAGDGIVRAWTTRKDTRPVADLAAALESARTEMDAKAGSLIVPVAPPDLPSGFDCFASSSRAVAIRRIEEGLRASFDPAGILAPDRFLATAAA